MRALVGVGDPAGHLARVHFGVAHEAEHRHRALVHTARHAVTGLLGAFRKIDAAPIQPGWCTGLQAALRQLQFLEPCRQRHRWWVARPASSVVVQPHMDLAVQKSPGRQHHRAAAKLDAHLRDGAHHAVALHHQVVHRLLKQPQIGLVLQHAADGGLVQNAVGLRARGPHGGALAAVENAELDAALVRGQRHGTAQRVHLFHQVALADAADAGVAAHLPQCLDVVREQQRAAAHARCGQRGLSACVATADNDDIKFLGIQHRTTPGPPAHNDTHHTHHTGQILAKHPPSTRRSGPPRLPALRPRCGKPAIFPPLSGARRRRCRQPLQHTCTARLGQTVSRETPPASKAPRRCNKGAAQAPMRRQRP